MRTLICFIALYLFCFVFCPIQTLAKTNKFECNTNYPIVQGEDKKAQFPGGKEALDKWLKENTVYPKDIKRYGSVIVTFTVKKNGALSDFKIHKSVNPDLDVAAIETLSGMPKWEVAVKDGKKINSMVQLPIRFEAQKE